MRKKMSTLRRFSELPPEADPQNVASLIRSAQAAPEDDLSELRWRLRTSLYRRPLRRRLILRVALVVVGVFVAGTVVGGMSGPFWRQRKSTEPVPATTAKPTPAPKRKAAVNNSKVKPAEPELIVETAPAEKPAMEAVPRSRPTLHPVRPRVEPPMIPPMAPTVVPMKEPAPALPSAIAVEQVLLSDIVKALRMQHDPRSALSLLDEHRNSFPKTALALEAALLRAEALLGLGRSNEALSQLDGVSLTSMPHGNDWLVLRGELRAAAGRWLDARRDFDQVMADAASRDLTERAWWGRASARSRMGDEAGARDDVAAYLRAFPSGRFAAQAAGLLQGAP